MLGLRGSARFSLVAASGLLVAVTFLLRRTGSRASELRGLWLVDSAVAAPGL